MAIGRWQRAPLAVEAGLRDTVSAGLQRLARQLSGASRACHGAATALLTATELARRRVALWNDFGLSADHIEQGLFRWEESFYPRLLRPNSRVLLVGCGSGRELLALLDRGHDVVGIDPAPHAIALARQTLLARGATPSVQAGLLSDLQLDGRFDAVVFTWFAYSYILGAAARVRDLVQAKELLGPDGRVLVSVPDVTGPGASRLASLMQVVGRLSGSDWVAEPGDFFDWIGPAGTWFQHQFAAGELEAEAQKAGLHVVDRRAHDGVAMLELLPAR